MICPGCGKRVPDDGFALCAECDAKRGISHEHFTTPVVDTKFEICRDVEYVLKIGRDYQNKDGFRGAHYDTVKLLCDTIEYLRDKMPKPDPDWNEICERCHEGEIEPKECKYYGEPNGCNSPIYREHPKEKHGNAAAMRDALIRLQIIAKAAFDKQREGVNTVNLPQAVWYHCEKALAEPPRNCDMCGGDFKMLHTAWYDWTGSSLGSNPDGTVKLTFGEWLLTLAGKRGAV